MATISIKDKPILASQEDLLNINKYAQALVHFILNSDTPITIGLQGEWGTGKTSMMYLLKEELQAKSVATSWVNTWEYSMFRGVKETTPAILNGLLTSLKESCGSQWTLGNDSEKKMKKIGKFFGNLINQVAVNQVGLDVKDAYNATVEESAVLRAEIAEIKKDIADVIDQLVNDSKNPFQRVVFFVDDLDRIQPSDAVEVLESLKNIFDMNHCIFILAIDYEVVVKGLEGKFGPKTDANEREFRSFFDKIIQVPFSMPTGAYDIEKFLDEKFKELGVSVDAELSKLYLDVVKHSVGFNPRSLKRFLNSFSLLNTIKQMQAEDVQENDQQVTLMLFALLGIQITYPKIFRLLVINSDYKSWDIAFATKMGLNFAQVTEQLQTYGENELIDEEWEQVAWGFCQNDTYLKSRAFNILELLNNLAVHFGDDQLVDLTNDALVFASITSVDDHQESRQAVRKVGNKTLFDGIDAKYTDIQKGGGHAKGLEIWKRIWTDINGIAPQWNAQINFAGTASTLKIANKKDSHWIYWKNPAKKSHGMKIWIKWGEQTWNEIQTICNDFAINANDEITQQEGGGLVLELKLASILDAKKYEEFLIRVVDCFKKSLS